MQPTSSNKRQYIAGTFRMSFGLMSLKGPPIEWTYTDMLCRLSIRPAIPPHLPFTRGQREDRLYDIYAEYVEKYGNPSAQAALKNGDQVIVGLRIETNTRANRGYGLYDDRLAIIWRGYPKKATPGHGCAPGGRQAGFIKHGADFVANTEPTAYYEEPAMHVKQIVSKKSGKLIQVKVADKIIGPDGQEVFSGPSWKWDGEDMNKDGRRDLGRLIPGTYKFYNNGKLFHSFPFLHQKGSQNVERDVNHDGLFTQDDIWQTDKGDMVIETGSNLNFYFHIGSRNRTGSAGCQTLPPHEHARFFHALKRQHLYYYVLVTLK
jgi:hypothetical protein